MLRIILFFGLAVVVCGTAQNVIVHQVKPGVFEIEIKGKRYSPTPKCDKADVYREFRCHTHCSLMGSQYGFCNENPKTLCKCEHKGNEGNAAYQKLYNDSLKNNKSPTTKPQTSNMQNKATRKKQTTQTTKTNFKTNAANNENSSKTKKPVTGGSTKPSTKTKKKTKTAGKKIPGTQVIEVFDSNEARMPNPTYNSAESKEK